MKVTGSHKIAAPRDKVFAMLQDPEVLAKITPGVTSMSQEDENRYKADLTLGVGPVKGSFKGHVEILEKNAPETMTLSVDGSGSTGGVRAEGRLRFEEEDGVTTIHYEGEPNISGRIASVGGRLLQGVAKKLAGQFFTKLDEQAQNT